MTTDTTTPHHDGRSPNGMATSTRITACTPIVTVLDSARPRISAERWAWVTR